MTCRSMKLRRFLADQLLLRLAVPVAFHVEVQELSFLDHRCFALAFVASCIPSCISSWVNLSVSFLFVEVALALGVFGFRCLLSFLREEICVGRFAFLVHYNEFWNFQNFGLLPNGRYIVESGILFPPSS